MHDYRKAFSEETLKKVDKFKYDNNFFNWEDPKVLKYFTKSKKSIKKAWKKTYGLPYVSADIDEPLRNNPYWIKVAQRFLVLYIAFTYCTTI